MDGEAINTIAERVCFLLVIRQRKGDGKRLKFEQNCRNFYRKFVDISRKVRIIVNRMDTQNDKTMAYSAIQAEIGCRKAVVGAKQLRKALAAGSVYRVYLARNADPAITEPLEALCQSNHVNYAWVRSMTDLGHACGIEVGAAAAAAVDL